MGAFYYILLADWKEKISTHTIRKISLNGITNTIKIVGSTSISFSKDRLSEESIEKLIQYLEEEVGLDRVEVSDNFRRFMSRYRA